MGNRKYWGPTWRRADIPTVDDPRWEINPDIIYILLHVQRQRCWVRWKQEHDNEYSHIKTSRKYPIPRVGLVVKPLDNYTQVDAVIPCGKQEKLTA